MSRDRRPDGTEPGRPRERYAIVNRREPQLDGTVAAVS